jgi:hypothetical protein
MTEESQEQTLNYVSLKLATARKTSQRAMGEITYRILCDEQRERLFITIVSNNGGGYFSKEVVPFDGVERCLAAYTEGKPMPAKVLRTAFVGKSVNNAGFLAAILRAEGLLAGVPDAVHQHQIAGDWTDWKEIMLCADGERYVPPTKPEVNSNGETTESALSEATESTNPEDGAGDSNAQAEAPMRKGRGSKPRQVGVELEQENDDARSS